MKARSELCNRLCDEPVSGPREDRRETTSSDRCAVTAVMNGRAASPGTALGRAAVVMNMDDMARLKKGAVIVSKTASPQLAMAIPKARGMATECGGQGAAASGFAREYGIPAVVGIAGLMKAVRDGDLLRVDGTKGTVEIVELNGRRLPEEE